MGVRILLVEDDRAIVEFVRVGFRQEGFEVACAATLSEARASLRSRQPDLVLLDLKLPGGSGMDVLREIRASGHRVPVVILSAQDEVAVRVLGLNAGADDYLTKPFHFEELVARVRAVIRRHRVTAVPELLVCGGLVVDPDSRTVVLDGAPVELTSKEFDLLEFLCANMNRVLTREVLMSRVWGCDWLGDSNVIEVLVSKLRRKLEDAGPRMIHTVRGVGYVMRAPRQESLAG